MATIWVVLSSDLTFRAAAASEAAAKREAEEVWRHEFGPHWSHPDQPQWRQRRTGLFSNGEHDWIYQHGTEQEFLFIRQVPVYT